MIDFIHLYSNIEDYNYYLESENLPFIEGITYRTKTYNKYFSYRNFTNGACYKVGYRNWLDFTGSITKYWYGENHNNLPYSDLGCALHELADSLSIKPNEFILQSFEFGLNIPLDFDLKALKITDSLLNFKNKFFEDNSSNSKEPSIGKRCKLQEYQIKLYSKSLQYKLPYELLRYEIKIHKMNYFKSIQLNTIEDLVNKDNLQFLKNLLIEKLNQILVYDESISIHLLNSKEQLLCKNWQSPIYRKNLRDSNLKKFTYERQKLVDVISKHGKYDIIPTIIKQVSDVWDDLMER